jgi:hypothetical protein
MHSTDQTSTNGSAWAAILAAAIGCASFGVLVDLAEAFKPVSKKLSFYAPTGDLSGKSTLAILAWLVAWAILHFAWKQRDIERTGKILTIVLLLILFALVATFPPFFGLFAAD